MLKILQARLQQYMNWEHPDGHTRFRKGRETRDHIVNVGSQRKVGNSRKTSTSASLITLKPLTVCITTNYGKLLKRWEYQITLSASCETFMQVKKQQLEMDMEDHVKCQAGWSTSWKQDAGRNIINFRYADDATLMAESKEELKSLLMKVKEENLKNLVKNLFKKLRSQHPVSSLHDK